MWRSILVPEAERDSGAEHLQLQLQRLRSYAGASPPAGHTAPRALSFANEPAHERKSDMPCKDTSTQSVMLLLVSENAMADGILVMSSYCRWCQQRVIRSGSRCSIS